MTITLIIVWFIDIQKPTTASKQEWDWVTWMQPIFSHQFHHMGLHASKGDTKLELQEAPNSEPSSFDFQVRVVYCDSRGQSVLIIR